LRARQWWGIAAATSAITGIVRNLWPNGQFQPSLAQCGHMAMYMDHMPWYIRTTVANLAGSCCASSRLFMQPASAALPSCAVHSRRATFHSLLGCTTPMAISTSTKCVSLTVIIVARSANVGASTIHSVWLLQFTCDGVW
jgi:hypothetical protein